MERMFDIEKTINDIGEYAEISDRYNELLDKYEELRKKYRRLEKEHKNLQVEHSRLLFDIDAVIEHEVDVKCKKLKEELEQAIYGKVDYKKSYKQADAKKDELLEENKNLKERIDVLYEYIERNDKLVDEVIDEEDLDKLNWYIYIDDDLVDRTLESED